MHLMDETGARLGSRRLPEGLAGIRGLHELVARHADEPGQVVIGIGTDRGLWVEALTAAGYQVYAINPLAVARYRDRHHLSGAKSDAGDAKLLADLVRTDRHNHRPVAGDSPEAAAIKVLARGHQNLIWTRNRHTNTLRSALREYCSAALEAFEDLAGTSPLTVASGRKQVVLACHIRNRRPLRRHRPVGLLLAERQPRMPSLLRPTPRRRRPPPLGTTRPRQPTRRHPPRLPAPPRPLRRTHRLGPPHQRSTNRRLTTQPLGCLTFTEVLT